MNYPANTDPESTSWPAYRQQHAQCLFSCLWYSGPYKYSSAPPSIRWHGVKEDVASAGDAESLPVSGEGRSPRREMAIHQIFCWKIPRTEE